MRNTIRRIATNDLRFARLLTGHHLIRLRRAVAVEAWRQRRFVEDLPAPQKKRILKPPSDD